MLNARIVLISHNILGFRCLRKMIDKKFNVVGVISRLKKPQEVISDYCDEFEAFCNEKNIKFLRCKNINDLETMNSIRTLNPDIVFVMGWSQIIKDEFFSIPKLGVFGTHPSLLPKNRGRAAIPWQIINEEKESGVTLFKIEPNKPVDSGDVYAQEKFSVSSKETAESFYEKAVIAAEKIVEKYLESILTGKATGKPQNENQATYLPRRRPEDGKINWEMDAAHIERFIRAVGKPYPGAFTYYQGKKIKIVRAAVSENSGKEKAAGTIFKSHDGRVLVQCGKGVLELIEITDENDGNLMLEILKPGSSFVS